MAGTNKLTGEFCRTVDDRYRLALPSEFDDLFKPEGGKCVLVKEGPGHLSLWEEKAWKQNHESKVKVIETKLNDPDNRIGALELQRLGRLLSTRSKEIKLAEKSRLVLPDGFREFLAVEPKQDVMVVGAWVCIELWHPKKWVEYVENDLAQFGTLLGDLSS